ncbi:hypothetical protein SUGI_0402060 [Cryptomeria japonica]|nr:hypothetical protein SUGI_0402060 [Cryptomeria japonica]
MESNLKLVFAIDNRLMAFRGRVKSERWGRILLELDDLSVHVQEIMGEDFLNYEQSYQRTIVWSKIGTRR